MTITTLIGELLFLRATGLWLMQKRMKAWELLRGMQMKPSSAYSYSSWPFCDVCTVCNGQHTKTAKHHAHVNVVRSGTWLLSGVIQIGKSLFLGAAELNNARSRIYPKRRVITVRTCVWTTCRHRQLPTLLRISDRLKYIILIFELEMGVRSDRCLANRSGDAQTWVQCSMMFKSLPRRC